MTFIEITCAHEGCGVTFCLSDGFVDRRKKDHKSFHCPNGHSQVYQGETDEEKAQREKARADRLSSLVQGKDREIARLKKAAKAAKKGAKA